MSYGDHFGQVDPKFFFIICTFVLFLEKDLMCPQLDLNSLGTWIHDHPASASQGLRLGSCTTTLSSVRCSGAVEMAQPLKAKRITTKIRDVH